MNSNEDATRGGIRLRKLPGRYAALVTPLLLSFLMTSIVSLVSTLRSIGFVPTLVPIWLGAWGVSWVIAFPTMLGILPWVRRATAAIVDVAPLQPPGTTDLSAPGRNPPGD